jgi:hypothetical protein
MSDSDDGFDTSDHLHDHAHPKAPYEYEYVVEVQSRYTDYLMHKPNVVGVSIGLADTDSDGDLDVVYYCIVVLVSAKVDEDDLAPEERIPNELDGVPVRVQEIGEISAQASTFSAGG